MQSIEFNVGVIKPVECVREAWELIRGDYWLLFAITIVGLLIGGISLYIAAGAMVCGTFYCFLRRVDGEPVTFDDLWKGMKWFTPGLVVVVAIVVPLMIVYGIIYGPILLAIVMGSNLSQSDLTTMLIGAFVVDLVFIVLMVCFHTLLMFAFPLIVDRDLGAIDAMMTSARAVWKNMRGVAGLILVNFGLVFAGYAALCVGVYLVIPVIVATHAVAYRKIFPQQMEHRFMSAYEGI